MRQNAQVVAPRGTSAHLGLVGSSRMGSSRMREHRRVELFLQPGRVLRTGFQLLVVRASMIPELGELRNHVALLGDLDVEPPSMKS